MLSNQLHWPSINLCQNAEAYFRSFVQGNSRGMHLVPGKPRLATAGVFLLSASAFVSGLTVVSRIPKRFFLAEHANQFKFDR